MLITCPTCSSTYQIGLTALGPKGRPVRCTRCQTVWFAAGTDAVKVAFDIDPPTPMQAAPPAKAADASPGGETTPPEDAEPAPVSSAPSIVPSDSPYGVSSSEPVHAIDVESAAARRERRHAARKRLARRRKGWPLAPLPTATIGMAAIVALLLAGRHTVVRAMPQTAWLFAAIGAPVNLRGLVIEEAQAEPETHDGVDVLSVQGKIVNSSGVDMPVPRLRFSLRNGRGQEIYAWTSVPVKDVISSRESLAFQSRLASPPPEARDLLIRFFHKKDAVAGIASTGTASQVGHDSQRGP